MASNGPVHIIDDDDALRDSLAFLMASAGLEAKTYESATKFMAEANGLRGGCILTDVRMPEISGIELLRQVRSRQPLCNVIMMTAFTSMDKVVECLSAGAVDYLVKPFDDLDAVVARIREAMARVERWRQTIAPV